MTRCSRAAVLRRFRFELGSDVGRADRTEDKMDVADFWRNSLRVCVSRRSKVASCCALDEGRPLGAALQEEASNRHERLLPNGDGRERHGQKARLDRVRYG